MLILAELGGPSLVLLGLGILAIAFVLRRGIVLGRRSRNRDVVAEVRDDVLTAERSAAGRIRELEVRLHDYGRDIEGRMETRIALLQELVHDSERKIAELRNLIEQSAKTDPAADNHSRRDPPDGVNAA
jgi:hypothetical protein